ncbi:MAG TPA: PIG-L family deacetylase [Gemmatimonadaceae bacterium]|nr:PIG-L family deacetylase [Gemmatimonadaceae bacterium]
MNDDPTAPSASGASRVLACVFAHPDDETFSSGATLARYSAAGAACHLLCATDGDAGTSSDIEVSSREELGRLRRAELHEAARVLGARSAHSLGLLDGGLPEADADALIGGIVRFLRAHRPQVVITFGPEGAPNLHRDHRAISRVATAAFFLAGLPDAYADQLEGPDALAPHAPHRLYYVSWEPPGPGAGFPHAVPLTARIDPRPWNDVKRAAFDAHRTQHVLRDAFERIAMKDTEAFALAAGTPQPRAVVEDLFEGL